MYDFYLPKDLLNFQNPRIASAMVPKMPRILDETSLWWGILLMRNPLDEAFPSLHLERLCEAYEESHAGMFSW